MSVPGNDAGLLEILTFYDRDCGVRSKRGRVDTRLRNLWAARLDAAVTRSERPVVLVAHGLSCFAVAWWARLSPASYVSRVMGALLVRPFGDDGERTGGVEFAGPNTLLPFPSMLVADWAAESAAQLRALAQGWGSRTSDAPSSAGGQGRWQIGERLLERIRATSLDGIFAGPRLTMVSAVAGARR